MKTQKTKNKIKRPYDKNRQAAANELFKFVKTYEKVSYSTIYKKCYFSKSFNCWRYIGKAHDYSF